MSSEKNPPSRDGTRTMMNKLAQSDTPILPHRMDTLAQVPILLNQHMGAAGLSTDALAELAGMNRSSLYRVLSGARRLTPGALVTLAFPLRLTVEQTQELLKAARRAALSPRDPRESVILHALMHGHSLGDTHDRLVEMGFKGLYSNE